MDLGGQLRLELEHSADFGRDRFIVSSSNQEAALTLDRWPQDQARALALIGPPGSGKTHLAMAWAKRTGATALQAQALMSEPPPSGRPMLLDDADRVDHGEAFFHLLNTALRPGGCLLVTGRTAPGAWDVQVPDLRSRLNALPIVELGAPDDHLLRGLLVKLFQERHIRPPLDLLAYLMRRIERSAASAQAIVMALDEAASAEGRPISRVLARQLLKDESEDERA